MTNRSITTLWTKYCTENLEDHIPAIPRTLRFGRNEAEGKEQATQVKHGDKTGEAHALLTLQYRKESLPKLDELFIVTDHDGEAQCIVRTTKMRLRPFFGIDGSHVAGFGAANGDLTAWKQQQWLRYVEELADFDRLPRESMIVVCHEFEKVFE